MPSRYAIDYIECRYLCNANRSKFVENECFAIPHANGISLPAKDLCVGFMPLD